MKKKKQTRATKKLNEAFSRLIKTGRKTGKMLKKIKIKMLDNERLATPKQKKAIERMIGIKIKGKLWLRDFELTLPGKFK